MGSYHGAFRHSFKQVTLSPTHYLTGNYTHLIAMYKVKEHFVQ